MGIALAVFATWLSLAMAWSRLRRSGAGPSVASEALVTALRRTPPAERVRLAADAPRGTWEGDLGRALLDARSSDERVELIDAGLADMEVGLVGSRAWDRVVPRIAILGGLFAASISVIRGGVGQALIAAAIGAVGAGVGVVLTRAAGSREARQRARADDVAQLLAGGRAGSPFRVPSPRPSRAARGDAAGGGLDRRRSHG